MTTRSALAFAFVLVVATVAPAALVTTTQAQAQCSNMVVYDEFRFNNATVDTAANGSATIQRENTKVRVEQATGFIRIHAENPNGYCNEVHVRLASKIVSPAELGTVEALANNTTAEWHAVRDFERDVTYTEVVFTLPAGSEATFAPSKLTVKSLAWTGQAKSAGGSLWDRLSGFEWGDDEDLRQRTYQFSARNNSSIVTLSLRNQSTGRTVEEWQAMYRVGDGSWTPISKDADAPVFYRTVGEHQIQFLFNDPDAEVQFTANPTTWDKAQYQFDSYTAGIDALGDLVELPDLLS